MKINIPTGQDIIREIAIQYVYKAFVYITDCNPPLRSPVQTEDNFTVFEYIFIAWLNQYAAVLIPLSWIGALWRGDREEDSGWWYRRHIIYKNLSF